MTRTRCAILGPLFLASMFAAVTPAVAQPEQRVNALATRELDVEGVVAEVIESDRKDGVLTVRVRFRNNGEKPATLPLVDAQGYVHTYVSDGGVNHAAAAAEAEALVTINADLAAWP